MVDTFILIEDFLSPYVCNHPSQVWHSQHSRQRAPSVCLSASVSQCNTVPVLLSSNWPSSTCTPPAANAISLYKHINTDFAKVDVYKPLNTSYLIYFHSTTITSQPPAFQRMSNAGRGAIASARFSNNPHFILL